MDIEDVLNENHSFDIPQSTFDGEIKRLVNDIKAKPGFDPNVSFDPKKHLNYSVMPKKYKFQDLGIPKTHVTPINEIAATDPFNLFTEEAVDLMKYEIFSNEALIKKYGRLNNSNNSKKSSELDFHISGFIDETVFCKAAWTSKELQQIFDEIMEDKLCMPHRYCLGHINVSLARSDLPELDETIDYKKLKEEQDKKADDINSGVSWHYDSPPLVCVMMLSAPPNMIGGETGIRLGDESVMRIPNTKVGCATMLQGRVIKHIATKPLNNFDRISYVTSFIAEDPHRPDSTCATSERPSVSSAFTNDMFYPTFLSYRFERIEKRLKSYREELMKNYAKGAKFDQLKAVEFMQEIEDYLKISYQDFEMIEEKPYPPPVFKIPYKDL